MLRNTPPSNCVTALREDEKIGVGGRARWPPRRNSGCSWIMSWTDAPREPSPARPDVHRRPVRWSGDRELLVLDHAADGLAQSDAVASGFTAAALIGRFVPQAELSPRPRTGRRFRRWRRSGPTRSRGSRRPRSAPGAEQLRPHQVDQQRAESPCGTRGRRRRKSPPGRPRAAATICSGQQRSAAWLKTARRGLSG